MRSLENVVAAVLLHLILFAAAATADIISLKLRSNNQKMIFFSEFEFSHGGYVSFHISSLTETSTASPPDHHSPSRMGFVLQSENSFNSIEQDAADCPLDFNNTLFSFQDLSHNSLDQSSFNKAFPVTSPGVYFLFFANCNRESLVNMVGSAELYNTDDGTTKNYLSAGITQLPFLCLILSFVYLCFQGVWMLVCFKNRRSFHMVHLLMSGLLAMNYVQLLIAAAYLYFVKVTGTPHGLDVLFCVFQFIRTVLLFTLIVLIFTGWCFWKPFLHILDMLALIIVILLKVWANVYSVFAWKSEPYNKERISWYYDSVGIDIICFFAIFVPMGFSLFSLIGKHVPYNAKGFVNGFKLILLGLVVFVYELFTMICLTPGVYDFIPTADYGAEELNLLVLSLVMFPLFRPSDEGDDDLLDGVV